jgi:L-fucose isomerase-like protein
MSLVANVVNIRKFPSSRRRLNRLRKAINAVNRLVGNRIVNIGVVATLKRASSRNRNRSS